MHVSLVMFYITDTRESELFVVFSGETRAAALNIFFSVNDTFSDDVVCILSKYRPNFFLFFNLPSTLSKHANNLLESIT